MRPVGHLALTPMLLQPNEKLDLILAYLRRVHCYCFYCAAEYDEESIMKQCGLTHVRGRKRDSSEADTSSTLRGHAHAQRERERERESTNGFDS